MNAMAILKKNQEQSKKEFRPEYLWKKHLASLTGGSFQGCLTAAQRGMLSQIGKKMGEHADGCFPWVLDNWCLFACKASAMAGEDHETSTLSRAPGVLSGISPNTKKAGAY